MLNVGEALAKILETAAGAEPESVQIENGAGRVLASDVISTMSQPPFRASAMDGYAVKFDGAAKGARLLVVGEAAAGSPASQAVGRGEAVRIFTGSAVPDGADHVVIQEEALRDGDHVVVNSEQPKRANIREAGVDFRAGDKLKRKGERLAPIDLGLIAAANIAAIDVFRKPVVAYFDNGDELREPGEALRHGQIIGSNRFAMNAMIALWGGAPRYLGRAGDNARSIREKFEAARDADVLITIGGASVGDHDHVRSAFGDAGGDLVFSKVSVRPGKPTWFGLLGKTRVLGLPGNPASAIVCAILFLKPLVAAAGGEKTDETRSIYAALAAPLEPNGPRETYLRGLVSANARGMLTVKPYSNQDSSLFSPLANGNCLIRRVANAPKAAAGEIAECLLYGALAQGGAG